MNFETISVRKLDYYIYNPYATIIDLRSACEFNKRHIRNAINICSETIEDSIGLLDNKKIIVLYCERGSLSLIVAKKLSERGFFVKSVIGGINMYNGKNIVYEM